METWTCTTCGKTRNKDFKFPIVCSCGTRDWGDGRITKPLTDEQRVQAKALMQTAKQEFAKSRGLGDTIAKLTTALGIKPCGGCKQRQETLNKLVPYSTS